MLGRMLQACRSAGLAQHCQRGRLLLARAQPLQAAQRHQLSCAALRQCGQQQQATAAMAAAARRWRQHSSLAAPPGSSQLQRPAKPAAAVAEAAAEESDEEEEEFEDEEEEEEEGADVIGELGDADDEEAEEWEVTEDDIAPQLCAGGTAWGEAALAVVQRLLAGGTSSAASADSAAPAELADIQLFSFRAIPSTKRLDIRLDKMTDRYGSPSLEDVAIFSRLFNAAYEAEVGEAVAGDIEVEVSSPGAERQVRVPGDLQRFSELPMKVEYALDDDKVETKVLTFSELDAAAGLTRWRLADVRVNRTGGKGRGLNRKQRDAVYELPLATLRHVNLHIDF